MNRRVCSFRSPAWWLGPYYLFAVLIGSLAYLNTDVRAYLEASNALLTGAPVYAQSASAYPPLFYAILAIPLVVITPLTESLTTPSFVTVLAVKSVVIGGLVITAAIGAWNLSADAKSGWLAFATLNPLVVIATVLFGQADAVAAIGFLTALVAWHRNVWWLAGFGVALAAAIKVYPALMAAPLLYRQREHIWEIIAGVAPVSVATALLMLYEYPLASTQFLNPNYPFGINDVPITGFSPKYPLVLLGFESVATALPLFAIGVVIAVAWSLFGSFDESEELALLVPLLPVFYLYSYNPSYRWLPFVLVLGYLGYYYTDPRRTVLLRYAWIVIIVGILLPGLGLLGQIVTNITILKGTLVPLIGGDILISKPLMQQVRQYIQFPLYLIHISAAIWAWHLLTTPSLTG